MLRRFAVALGLMLLNDLGCVDGPEKGTKTGWKELALLALVPTTHQPQPPPSIMNSRGGGGGADAGRCSAASRQEKPALSFPRKW